MSFLDNLNEIKSYVDANGGFANPNAGLAIASVAGAESGGNPTIVNSIGATGLFQDYQSRATNLSNYLSSNGLDLTSVDGQTQNMLNEINSGGYPATAAILNNPDASLAQMQGTFINEFEDPGGNAFLGTGGAGQDMGQANTYAGMITGNGTTQNTGDIASAGSDFPYTDPNAVDQSGNYAYGFTGQSGSGAFNLGDSGVVGVPDQTGSVGDISAANPGDASIGANLGAASSAGSFGASPDQSSLNLGTDDAGFTNTSAINSFGQSSASSPYGDLSGAQSLNPNSVYGSVSYDPADATGSPGLADSIATMSNPSQSLASVPGTSNSQTYSNTLGGMWDAMGVTAVTTAGNTVATATGSVATATTQAGQATDKQMGQDTQAATGTATSLTQSLFSAVTDWFVRGGVLLFGLIFLAGGVWFFSRQEA